MRHPVQDQRTWYDVIGRLFAKLTVALLVLVVLLQIGHHFEPLHRMIVKVERLEGKPMN